MLAMVLGLVVWFRTSQQTGQQWYLPLRSSLQQLEQSTTRLTTNRASSFRVRPLNNDRGRCAGYAFFIQHVGPPVWRKRSTTMNEEAL